MNRELLLEEIMKKGHLLEEIVDAYRGDMVYGLDFVFTSLRDELYICKVLAETIWEIEATPEVTFGVYDRVMKAHELVAKESKQNL